MLKIGRIMWYDYSESNGHIIYCRMLRYSSGHIPLSSCVRLSFTRVLPGSIQHGTERPFLPTANVQMTALQDRRHVLASVDRLKARMSSLAPSPHLHDAPQVRPFASVWLCDRFNREVQLWTPALSCLIAVSTIWMSSRQLLLAHVDCNEAPW